MGGATGLFVAWAQAFQQHPDSILQDLHERAAVLRSQRLMFFEQFWVDHIALGKQLCTSSAHCCSDWPRDRLFSRAFALSCNDPWRDYCIYPRSSRWCRELIRITRWIVAAPSLRFLRRPYLALARELCISGSKRVPNTGQCAAQPYVTRAAANVDSACSSDVDCLALLHPVVQTETHLCIAAPDV